ncbi:MAG: RusA family crossover junction endodeoxyribonuclease [Thermodesulfobacteriota bacterium]
MSYINMKISGIPYAKGKTRGNIRGPEVWTNQIIDQTAGQPTVDGPCILRVTFLMPPDKYPKDFPYGPDIDNYLKRFQDALNKTIFKNAPGGDSCIMLLEASKVKVASNDEAGAHLEILPHVSVR